MPNGCTKRTPKEKLAQGGKKDYVARRQKVVTPRVVKSQTRGDKDGKAFLKGGGSSIEEIGLLKGGGQMRGIRTVISTGLSTVDFFWKGGTNVKVVAGTSRRWGDDNFSRIASGRFARCLA